MQITVSVTRGIIIDNNVNSLYINAATKNVSSHQDSFLEGFERRISLDSEIKPIETLTNVCFGRTYRSSCARPECMQMLGKL